MSDYNLTRLGAREFEHLIQSLATRIVASGVSPFGDGPDGGREASFRGRASYPSSTQPWDGYIVVQCKFRQRPLGARQDGQWALRQLKSELEKYTGANSERIKPEYYLFVTNVVLTPTNRTGTKDKAFALLKERAPVIGLKGFDIWDYDAICRHLAAEPSVRRSFAALVTPDDVIAELLTQLPTKQRRDIEQTLVLFLQRELRASQYVRLEQAGLSAEQRTPLARVFVDLPYSVVGKSGGPPHEKGAVGTLIAVGNTVLRPSARTEFQDAIVPDDPIVLAHRAGRSVLLGGPGQGKSTAAQFVCQLHRAALLSQRSRHVLNPETIPALDALKEQCGSEGIDEPVHVRFPVHLVLERFAAALARGEVDSVLAFIARHISIVTGQRFSVEELRDWLSIAPWLLVMDGLDEVPATSNRAEVLENLAAFRDELAALDADVQLVATTRPQGYSNEFASTQFAHLQLIPLGSPRALHYAKRLTQARHAQDPSRTEAVLERLRRALAEPATAKLMETPLQVTLMATLVEQIGEPPRERWRLFHQYYNAVYAREIERDIVTSRLLQGRRADVDAIHHRVGLLLQTEGERPSTTGEAARLTGVRFARLVRDRLEENGAEGSELDSLTGQIEKAATDRLVFVVQPEEDRFGFEIRSLQEFTAAEALLTGRESNVRARLAAIAPIAYWRNVFLFAVGRCFADTQHQHFREDILEICDELNDPTKDSLTSAAFEGSRLALDVLLDGVAREQPRYSRWLAERALKLLGAPLEDGVFRPEETELANAYNSSLQTVYEEAIRLRLDMERFEQRLPSWGLLCRLADQGIEWAIELATARWPDDIEQRKLIIKGLPTPIKGKWTLLRVLESLPDIDPSWWKHSHLPARLDQVVEDPTQIPQWILSVAVWIRGSAVNSEEKAVFPTARSFKLISDTVTYGRLFLNVQSEEWSRLLASLPFPPPSKPHLEVYRATVEFAVDPRLETLASALRAVASHRSQGFRESLPRWAPWPLVACVAEADTPEDLVGIAEHASSGGLGSPSDWREAERRWEDEGVSIEEISFQAECSLPIGPWIRERGFPLAAANSHFTIITPAERLKPLLSAFQTLQTENAKETIAELCLHAISPDAPDEFEDIPQPDFSGSVAVRPGELQSLLTAAPRAPFRLTVLGRIVPSLDDGKEQEWIEFVDQLGREDADQERAIVVDFGRDQAWAQAWPVTETLVSEFIADPSRAGLLNMLSVLAVAGAPVSLPAEALQRYHHLSSPAVRESIVLLEIAGAGEWTATKLATAIIQVAEASDEPLVRLQFILAAMEHQITDIEHREKVILELRRKLLDVPALAIHAGLLWHYLRTLLIKRLSPLQEFARWRAFGLPDFRWLWPELEQ